MSNSNREVVEIVDKHHSAGQSTSLRSPMGVNQNGSMHEGEQQLLENMLDALDRLYDHQSSALDVQALALATAAAVSSPDMARELSEAASALQAVVRSRLGEPDEYDAALVATYDLRRRLAAAL